MSAADELRAELAEHLPEPKRQEEVYRRQLLAYQQGLVDLIAQVDVLEAQTPEPGEAGEFQRKITALIAQARNASASIARLKGRLEDLGRPHERS